MEDDDQRTTTRELFDRFFPGREDVIRLLMEPITYANGSTLEDPAITYGIHGELKPGAAALVGIPAVVGVLLGSSLQQRISNRRLTYGFGLLLAAIAVRLLI